MKAPEIILNLNWTAIGILLSLLTGWSGLLLGAIKVLVGREIHAVDEKFKALGGFQEKNQREHEENRLHHAEIEKQILLLRTELPHEYVQREDWIRFSGTLEYKVDAIHKRIDALKDEVRSARP